MTVAELKQEVILKQEVSLEDFFVLLAFVSGKSKTFLFAHEELSLSKEQSTHLQDLLKRRALHEPVSYLTGSREFFGREFLVTPDTLIPRPETELMVEEVLDQVKNTDLSHTFIDIGTGSGAIILTLAQELTSIGRTAQYLALDISDEALQVAKKNKSAFGDTQVQFLQSDLLISVPEIYQHDNLIFLANLPYVPEEQYRNAMPDVILYEPALALVSGRDGLDHYRRLISELASRKLESFTLYLEIDPSQTMVLQKLIHNTFADGKLEVIKDLQNHDRIIRLIQ